LTRSVNWKPVIAAPHGYAMGLALGIVLECDLIVAAAGTKFQVTETSRGLGGAKYWALLNFRGAAAFATEVTLTGRFFTAEEALAAGIINRVAPEGRHLEVAYELAAEVAKNPPLSVRATVRTRRWYMDQLEREVTMQTAPLKLLPVGGLPGSRPRLRRKAQARPLQGPLTGVHSDEQRGFSGSRPAGGCATLFCQRHRQVDAFSCRSPRYTRA
jgi:Enoyl-CoA hydratase/isomerase